MSRWSDPKLIREELTRKWESGRILRSLLVQDELFPLRMPLQKPKSSEVNKNFAEISQWIRLLKDHSKEAIGYGYELVEKEIVHRQSGRNLLPTHVVIVTVRDALRLIKKEREADKFLDLARMIKSEWPVLEEWISKYPHKVLANAEEWIKILAVLKWFFNHPRCNLYLRQLNIPGIDTKFIEQRKVLLAELLNTILPEDAIEKNTSCFELRYGLRIKPVQVRLRLLDEQDYIQGISDLTVPVEQMAGWKPRATKVFITENEINGLCFPNVSNGLVIFGLGYGLDVLKAVDWLSETEIHYWGDIDTHGFAMLDQIRSFLPQTKSILMDESILLSHRDLWSIEEKPSLGQLTRLSMDEFKLFNSLQTNLWGKGVRLEQERISFKHVTNAIEAITQ